MQKYGLLRQRPNFGAKKFGEIFAVISLRRAPAAGTQRLGLTKKFSPQSGWRADSYGHRCKGAPFARGGKAPMTVFEKNVLKNMLCGDDRSTVAGGEGYYDAGG